MSPRTLGQRDELVVNDATGEVHSLAGGVEVDLIGVEEIAGAIRAQRNGRGRKKPGEGWSHKVWGMIDMEVAAKLSLSAREFSVLLTIAAKVENKINIAHMSQAEICRATGMDSGNVARIVRKLVGRNLLIRQDRDHWMISPWLYYRGSSPEWEEATAKAEELVY